MNNTDKSTFIAFMKARLAAKKGIKTEDDSFILTEDFNTHKKVWYKKINDNEYVKFMNATSDREININGNNAIYIENHREDIHIS